MIILSIETSCDETAVAVLDCSGNLADPQFRVLSSTVSSQIKLHEKWGGVVPMLAKREHALNLVPVLEQALREAGLWVESGFQNLESTIAQDSRFQVLASILSRDSDLISPLKELLNKIKKPEIDAIAVTNGPGLEPALWVGVSFAKALSTIWNIPVYPANHMKGHVLAGLLETSEHTANLKAQKPNPLKFPILALLVSGGHTELDLIRDWTSYKTIGETRDDAAGEAFDKVARLLGLPYPGGPQISRLAHEARITGNYEKGIKLPRPMIKSGDLDFSFAGLKTAVRYLIEKLGEISPAQKSGIALEFENAVVEVLVSKTKEALEQNSVNSFVIGGGVAANNFLKTELMKIIEENFPNIVQVIPDAKLTTDNAAMIGAAAYIAIMTGTEPQSEFRADGGLKISE